MPFTSIRGHHFTYLINIVWIHEIHHGKTKLPENYLLDGLSTDSGQPEGNRNLYLRCYIGIKEWKQKCTTYSNSRSQNGIRQYGRCLLRPCALFVASFDLMQSRSKGDGSS